jgi:predicted ATPase
VPALSSGGTESRRLRLRSGTIDLGRQRIETPDGVVSLTTRESELLAYLSARPGEAVAREELLVEVWNYKATNPTRAVDLAVKRLRAKVEPNPSDPIHILSVHGVGYRFVPLGDAAPPMVGRAAVPERRNTNLTPERTRFIGRVDELARLRELTEDGARLITVVGPAGAGKTRLIRRFGESSQAALTGGVWFCDLADATSLDGVLSVLQSGLEMGVEPTERGIVGALAALPGPALLLLDNFEQLPREASAALGRWLDEVPSIRFLVSSRERLHLHGERLLHLDPLPPEDGVALLVDRARAVRRGLTLSEEDGIVLREIVEQLDGLPLALELAASRLGTLSPTQLRARLARRFRLLGDRRSDRPRRHATLLGALDWSWDLLEGEEKNALARLSVFEGGFSLEAAEEVLDDGNTWPADLIQALRDKSLVAIAQSGRQADVRFRLLESVRAYAAQQLDKLGLGEDARARHVAYYLREGEELAKGLHGPGGVDRLADLVRERNNLLAACRHARDTDESARLAVVAAPVVRAVGPASQLHVAIERIFTHGDLSPALRARVLVEQGLIWLRADRVSEAAGALDEAMSVEQPRMDVRARALVGMGEIQLMVGELDEAATLHREAVDLCQRIGWRSGEANARQGLAEVLGEQGCDDEAVTEYQRALRAVRRAGDRWSEGEILGRLGVFELTRSVDASRAKAILADAESLLEEAGDRGGILRLLTDQGVAMVLRGEGAKGLTLVQRALAAAVSLGDPATLASVQGYLGWTCRELGDLETAALHLDHALTWARAADDRALEGTVLRHLGVLRSEEGRTTEAEAALREAVIASRDAERPQRECVALLCLGTLLLETDRTEEAQLTLEQAVAMRGSHIDKTHAMALLAVVRAMHGDLSGSSDVAELVFERTGSRPDDEMRLGAWKLMLDLVCKRRERSPGIEPLMLRAVRWMDVQRSAQRSDTRWAIRLLGHEVDRVRASRRAGRTVEPAHRRD